MNYTVSQIGARQHYAVARAFHQARQLRRLYTDVWCGRFLGQRLRWGPTRRLAGRWHQDVPDALVRSCSLGWAFERWRVGRGSRVGRYDQYLSMGSKFGRWTARQLERQSASRESDVLFAFNTGALEALSTAKERGFVTIVDQIDPARVEEDLVAEESALWPGWQPEQERAPHAYWERLRSEWDMADLVLVNSPWSKRALVQQGVDEQRIIIVPHAFEGPLDAIAGRDDPDEPLNVLWLGHVNLRKGIQYLVGAAKLLSCKQVRIVAVGPLEISEGAVSTAPENLRFVGAVSRMEAAQWYRRADIFVLPTISDGFAITQLEAMAHGLPVITTDHCGEVVTDGVDGIIVPARSCEALAVAIQRFASDRDLLRSMSVQAVEKVRQFSLERFARGVQAGVRGCLDKRGEAGLRMNVASEGAGTPLDVQ